MMQASNSRFFDQILAANNVYYFVPVYQRNYAWREVECETLIKDVFKVYNGEYSDHFIGTIVIKPEDGNSNNLNVIDGQQRLTTMFLLCKAIMDTTTDAVIKSRMEHILFDQYTKEPRLVPIKSDNEVFLKLINNQLDELSNHSSRIYLNYLYFVKYLTKENYDSNRLIMALQSLPCIRMELHYDDNPQVIFESINSTGLSLSIADLIRNFLLMNEKYSKQEELFNDYWFKFEQKLGVDNLIMFFEHFLNIKVKGQNINRSDMYMYFKKYFTDNNYDSESLLVAVSEYIDCYQYLVNYDLDYGTNAEFNTIRCDIINMKNQVVNMFLMEVLLNHKKGLISEEELVYAFNLTLSYVFRRSVVSLSTNSMQKTFRMLYSQINDKSNLGFIDALNYALVTSKANTGSRFPTDIEFKESLATRNLYGKFSNLYYLLYKLENINNKTLIGDLTIEHVLPQTLTPYWKEVLGSEYKVLHEDYVNDLGNLTLTSYNSNMSNFDFAKKKEILAEEGHIKLNRYFTNLDSWNIEQISNRSKELANSAVKIWPYPTIDEDIAIEIENAKYITHNAIDLHDSFITGLKVNSIIINDEVIKTPSYRHVISHIAKVLIEEDKEKFLNLFLDTNVTNGYKYNVVSYDKTTIYTPELIEGIYVEVAGSGIDILKRGKTFCEEFDFNFEDIEIRFNR